MGLNVPTSDRMNMKQGENHKENDELDMDFDGTNNAQDQDFEEKVNDYQNHPNKSFSKQNRQKEVKDELNVDRMKYAAYLDEDKDPRAQSAKLLKGSSSNQFAAIEEHLGLNKDGMQNDNLPRKSRQTLDYIQIAKQQAEQQKKAKKHKKAEDDSEESSDEEGQNFEILYPEQSEQNQF